MTDRTLLDYANPAQGTESVHAFSQGNTLPLVARPFAMTHWGPQTEEGNRFYKPSARQIQGIRATHQPSPWIGDYGHFLLCPQSGDRLLGSWQRNSTFRPDETTLRPHYFKTVMRRYRTTVEFTPTERCALLRMHFPSNRPARLIVDLFDGACHIDVDGDGNGLSGYTRANSGGVPDNFALYFYIEIYTPICDRGVFSDGQLLPAGTKEGDGLGAFLEVESGGTVTARIATSFISVEQAKQNLEREVGQRSFDAVLEESADTWANILNRIQNEKPATDRCTHFTPVYIALISFRAPSTNTTRADSHTTSAPTTESSIRACSMPTTASGIPTARSTRCSPFSIPSDWQKLSRAGSSLSRRWLVSQMDQPGLSRLYDRHPPRTPSSRTPLSAA